MRRIIARLMAVCVSVLLANACIAQTVGVGGPAPPSAAPRLAPAQAGAAVTTPQPSMTSAQFNRVVGGLNLALPGIPPTAQPAIVAGTAGTGVAPVATQGAIVAGTTPDSPMRQRNSALQLNRLFGGLNSTGLLPSPLPVSAANAPSGASLLATQVGYRRGLRGMPR
jgi:hypothetical protein